MTVTEDVVVRLKQLDMDTIHIKLKGKGRIDVCTPGLGALSVMRDIARFGMMIGRILFLFLLWRIFYLSEILYLDFW